MALPTPKAIGIFGGTFDPFHFGHLRLITTVQRNLQLQEIRLIPCAQPLLRDAPLASAEQRLEMLNLIAQNYTWLKVDDREIKRGGLSYTLETVTTLRQELPETPLCFLMSIDQFAQFDHWHGWKKIPNFVHLVVTNRPDWTFSLNEKLQQLLNQRQIKDKQLLHQTLSGYIFLQTIDALAISSTDIRARLKAGENVSDLLPEEIYSYIRQKKLYR